MRACSFPCSTSSTAPPSKVVFLQFSRYCVAKIHSKKEAGKAEATNVYILGFPSLRLSENTLKIALFQFLCLAERIFLRFDVRWTQHFWDFISSTEVVTVRINVIIYMKRQEISLLVQWLRISLPMQGINVGSLVWEGPQCHGATKPMYNY